MRFAIIGPAQSGKTTFSEFLADILGIDYADSSAWIVETETFRQNRLKELGADFVVNGWDEERGRPRRELLIGLGDAVCAARPSFLIERAFEKADIVAGVRRLDEFETLPDDVVTIYIDRPGYPKVRDNFEIPRSAAKFIIVNDGTLHELKEKAYTVATSLG